MTSNDFIKQLLQAAKDAGIEAAEIYYVNKDSFKTSTAQGAIADYSVNTTMGLSLRGIVKGKMGYASTEAMDDEAVKQLVFGVLESAQLTEDDSVQEIYHGDKEYPKVNVYNPDLDKVEAKEKLDCALALEKKVLSIDPRITQVGYNILQTNSTSVRIVNSYGMDISARDNMAMTGISAVARVNDRVTTGSDFAVGRSMSELDLDTIAQNACEEALFMLNAAPVPSGMYRTIIANKCMPDLLAVFSSIFSAESVQEGTSLLAGREGEMIANENVTLYDDPLLENGLATTPFDAEGVASKTKAVIENGKLITLLHNLKTARKAGVASTGNASKAGYTSPIHVSPTNFYFKKGEKSFETLLSDMGNGIVITEVSGLHAGANAISGDFSLIAKGYTVKDGKKDKAVEQITVAGNFYQLLKNIREFADDLIFPGSPIGSPSVDVGEISIAG